MFSISTDTTLCISTSRVAGTVMRVFMMLGQVLFKNGSANVNMVAKYNIFSNSK